MGFIYSLFDYCRELADFTQADWDTLLNKPELVFARASPQDKLTIVRWSFVCFTPLPLL
jgi:hypothetical protein